MKNRSAFDKKIIRIGQITMGLTILAGFIPSLYLYFVHGVEITVNEMITAALSIFVVYGVFYPIEPLSYYASMGMAGTYMGWLAGNVGNMRVPSIVMAKESTEVEDGTPEAELVSIMGVAGSVVIHLVILTIGVFVGSAIMDSLPPIVQTALNSYLLPGIFGGMFGLYGIMYPKIGIPAFVVILGLNLLQKFGIIPNYVVLVLAVFGTLAFARVMYKKGKV